jgi:cytochrome c peroxidase
LFSNAGFHRNAWPSSGDAGRAGITQDLADTGRFKVPSLRNVAVTYPYMHDGSAKTLAEVIDHYASLTEQSSQVDSKLPAGMHFNDQEKNDLIEFLNALTDDSFLSNPLFAP